MTFKPLPQSCSAPALPDGNVCTGTALPIDLSHRECRPFQPFRLTQSRPTALNCRLCAQINRVPLTGGNQAPIATAKEPEPLSP
jgi:hypothetical protein